MSVHTEPADRGPPRLAVNLVEAAKCLCLAKARIYDTVKRGEITVRRNKKRSLVEIAELQRFVRSLP